MKQHTRTLGQVFLHDQNIIEKIISLGSPKLGQSIIEIGCGKGILTAALSKIGPVSVIEIDERWLNHVQLLNLNNVQFTLADVLTVDFKKFPKQSAIIANIPYQITTPLIEHLSQFKYDLGSITIMIQKELADRLCANEGSKQYGAMSIFCQYHFEIDRGFFVSRNCFSPKPNVDSFVIKLTAKEAKLNKDEEPLFFSMTRSFFWGRRKTMLTCLKTSPYIQLNQEIPKTFHPQLKLRGEDLSLNDLLILFRAIQCFIDIKKGSPIIK